MVKRENRSGAYIQYVSTGSEAICHSQPSLTDYPNLPVM